jgi:hypothetical protein
MDAKSLPLENSGLPKTTDQIRMKTNPYYTWLRERTARHHFARLTEVGVRPVNTNAQILDLFTNECRRWLPTIRNRHFDDHIEGWHTLYFQGNGQASVAETLVMIDIDCLKCLGLGSKKGALSFAAHLREEFFPDLYYEPSTNGNGVHGYFVLHKLGVSARDVNAVLFRFEKWLKQEARRAGADIEGVEIKGTCPVFEYEGGNLVHVKAGTNAKLPRGDVRATTHIDITDLAKFVPVAETVPLVRRNSRSSSSASWCPKAITPDDLADLPRLRKVAALLGLPDGKCSGRVAVTVEDVAVFLLLLRFFTNNMNNNGTLPWARFEALWAALYHAGDVERAFNPKRFAAVRNHLSSLILDGEVLLEWEDETYSAGRACKWRASEKLMNMIEQEREETSSAETTVSVQDGFPRPTASWKPIREENEQMRRLLIRVGCVFEENRGLAA